jgi:bacteriorhodopsin
VLSKACLLAAGYPVLFMLGSEGFFGKLSPWGSVLGHCIVDVLSKNVSMQCRSVYRRLIWGGIQLISPDQVEMQKSVQRPQ